MPATGSSDADATSASRSECAGAYAANADELSRLAVVEGKDGVARLGTDRLDRMSVAFRKVPEVSRTIVCDFRFPLRVNDRHLAVPSQYIRPLR